MKGDNENEENEVPDAFEMSDEDFLKTDPSVFETEVEEKEETDPAKIEEERRAALTDEERTAEDGADDNDDDPTKIEEDRRAALTDEEREAEDVESGDAAKVEKGRRAALTDTEREAEDATSDTGTTDAQYVDIGKQIMGEFKANGKTMKVKSADDAIQLMQMGANYHQKMAGLKPSLKTLKLLESNDLLDPAKLNYLIDLSQNKPEAITKLLRDSKIDPQDIDVEGDDTYVPSQRTVNDTEMLLDEVLDSIEGSKFQNQTLTVIGEVWDENSKAAVAKDPEIIGVINSHMENGIYEQVVDAVNYDRSMGKLKGVSDFDAYQRVGAHMNENKLFVGSTVNNSDNKQNQSNSDKSQSQERVSAEETKRLERKNAASPSRQKGGPKGGKNKDYNPLAMSDEDFMKLNNMSM